MNAANIKVKGENIFYTVYQLNINKVHTKSAHLIK